MPVNIHAVKPGDLLVYTSGRQSDKGSVVRVLRVEISEYDEEMLTVKFVKPAPNATKRIGAVSTLFAWRFEYYFGALDEELSPIEMKIRIMATRHESRRQYAGIN